MKKTLYVLVLLLIADIFISAELFAAKYSNEKKIEINKNDTKIDKLKTVKQLNISGVCSVENPKYSGNKIVFNNGIYGVVDIWSMNADGTGQTRLTSLAHKATDTEGPLRFGEASISPDGTKIAFTRLYSEGNPPTGYSAIYTMDLNGMNMNLLSIKDKSKDSSPTWSPDGRKILFISTRDGDSEVYTMNANGSDQVRLTHMPGAENYPNYSPDGTKIIFSYWNGTKSMLCIMQADGKNRIETGIEGFNPKWCPNGSKITFVRGPSSLDCHIFIMNSDYSGVTQLTSSPGAELYYDWSPDGSKIVYVHYPKDKNNNPVTEDSVSGIYTMNPNGSQKTRIATTPDTPGANFGSPTW